MNTSPLSFCITPDAGTESSGSSQYQAKKAELFFSDLNMQFSTSIEMASGPTSPQFVAGLAINRLACISGLKVKFEEHEFKIMQESTKTIHGAIFIMV